MNEKLEQELINQMFKAEERISKALNQFNLYPDDSALGFDPVFRVGVFHQEGGDPIDYFVFVYNDSEDVYGTLEEQVDEALTQFLEDFIEEYIDVDEEA